MGNSYPVRAVGTRFVLPVHVSFETNEQWTDVDLPELPVRVQPVAMKAVATKAIAGTDNGTIVLKKGTTSLGTITFTASDAIGTARSATPTAANFETTDKLRLSVAKTTAGGKAILFLTLEVLPSH